MFTKAHIGRVWWPVTLAQYDEAGDRVETTIRLLFQPLTRAERNQRQREALAKATDSLRDLRAETDLSRPADDSTSAARIGEEATEKVMARLDGVFAATEEDVLTVIARTHDWRGLRDEANADIPFSPEFFADLMAHEIFARPVLSAFAEASEGAVRKNSEPGHAGTPA
jgi:hypothetical protein